MTSDMETDTAFRCLTLSLGCVGVLVFAGLVGYIVFELIERITNV